MSKTISIAKNTSYIIIGNIIFRILSLFITIYLARYLDVEGFGKLNFILTYISTFAILSSLGTERILIREISRDMLSAPRLLGNTFIIRVGLSIFAIIMSIVIINLFHYPQETIDYIYLASFILIFSSFSEFYSSIFQSKLKMEYETYSKIISKIIYIILIFLIIVYQGTLKQIIIITAFSEFIKLFLIYIFSLKIISIEFDIDLSICKYLIKESIPIAISTFLGMIYFSITILMLSYISGDISVGYYSAALKLSDPFIIIAQALSMSLFPIMSRSFIDAKAVFEKTFYTGFKLVFLTSIPITVGIFLLADKFILLIFKIEYFNSILTLQILIWSMMLISFSSITLTSLISMNKQKINVIISLVCLIVNIILNYVLIPKLDFNGAAISSLFISLILFLMSYYFVTKTFSKHIDYGPLAKIILSASIMGLYITLFSNMNLIVLILTSITIYILLIFLLKIFNEDEMNRFNKIPYFNKIINLRR